MSILFVSKVNLLGRVKFYSSFLCTSVTLEEYHKLGYIALIDEIIASFPSLGLQSEAR